MCLILSRPLWQRILNEKKVPQSNDAASEAFSFDMKVSAHEFAEARFSCVTVRNVRPAKLI